MRDTMNKEQLLQEAQSYQEKLIEYRTFLHQNVGTGFDIDTTVSFVENQLKEIGLEPQRCGMAGLVVNVGGKKEGKVFLLRADMDGLPMQEEADVDFASKNGNMHACGHDMHTTMLLGAARLLKEYENEINGTVKLMFEPAEEIFEGAKDMIQAGVLKNPDVDSALMIHVMAGQPFPSGTVIVSDGGVSAPGADFFYIRVQGQGCHGSMPNTGVDPITVAAHIITGIQEIQARELALVDEAVLTIGTIHAGQAPNVIPDMLEMRGTIRTYDEEVRAYIKKRLVEISQGVATTFRANAEVSFEKECPVLQNNQELSTCMAGYMSELLGAQKAFTQAQLLKLAGGGKLTKSAGSEDFAYISQEVPSIMLALAAGNPNQGYCFPQHHPKVKFDNDVLATGSAVYAYAAMRWLEEHL